MTFWKISETRLNCLISLTEIGELGYTLEELMQNRERTQEFLNLIFEKGKEALNIQSKREIQSFFGALLPDKSLLLSIFSAEKVEEAVKSPILTYQLIFPALDNVIQFCAVFDGQRASGSRLYEDDELYYLMVDFPNDEEGQQNAMSVITAGEFGGLVEMDSISEIFLREHEEMLIADHAWEKLCSLEKD